MIKPPPLQKGDRVSVIAPSGIIKRQQNEAAIDIIRGWGLELVRGENLYSKNGIYAGSDEQRLSDLQLAFDDNSVKAVFCARGGYGLSRIIDSVDFSRINKSPKWVIGYSDVTVLHLWLNCLNSMISVHGEMLLNFNSDKKTTETFSSLKDILFGKRPDYSWKPSLLRDGSVEAEITGGNLSLIYNLMGAIAITNALKGKVLFIEETSEYYYSLDRMMMGLKLSGVLSSIKGLIIGGLSKMKDSYRSYGMRPEEIVMNAVREYNYPVVFDFPAGHIPDNRALLLGSTIRLQAGDDRASLEYINP